jgi:two-component sensor histidine kinase
VSPSPVRVGPGQINSLALIVNELATNTFKYAAPAHDLIHITVQISSEADEVTFEFRDNGPGYPAEVLNFEGHNVGLYLVQSLTQKGLMGQVHLRNDGGAVAAFRFKPLL